MAFREVLLPSLQEHKIMSLVSIRRYLNLIYAFQSVPVELPS